MANKISSYWPHVVNLANSIIGVSVLALPLCFQNCGVLLGLILMLTSAWLSYVSCVLLTKGASVTRKRSYEFLAFNTFGQSGKLAVEIGTMGLMLGTLVAFFIILGDLCPFIISNYFNIENSVQLRTTTLLFLGLFVVLPLSMKTNLESISKLSTLSLSFYVIFALHTMISSFPHMKTWEFMRGVKYWDTNGVFSSLPIFSLSYACQIQLFLVYHSAPEISIKEASIIVKRSIMLSSVIYLSVAYFGYVAFYDHPLNGDVLMNFPTTPTSTFIKFAFCASTIFSFPLCIYPCRNSLYTLLFSESLHDNLGGQVHIPMNLMKFMTFVLVAFTLTIGILVPKVEFILGLTGSTLGSLICFLLPSATYLSAVHYESTFKKALAKMVLLIGFTLVVVSTMATLSVRPHQHNLVNFEDPQVVMATKASLTLPDLAPTTDSPKKQKPSLSEPALKVDKKANSSLPHLILRDSITIANLPNAPLYPVAPISGSTDDLKKDSNLKSGKDFEDFNINAKDRNGIKEDVKIENKNDIQQNNAKQVDKSFDNQNGNRNIHADDRKVGGGGELGDMKPNEGAIDSVKKLEEGVQSVGEADNKKRDVIKNNNNNIQMRSGMKKHNNHNMKDNLSDGDGSLGQASRRHEVHNGAAENVRFEQLGQQQQGQKQPKRQKQQNAKQQKGQLEQQGQQQKGQLEQQGQQQKGQLEQQGQQQIGQLKQQGQQQIGQLEQQGQQQIGQLKQQGQQQQIKLEEQNQMDKQGQPQKQSEEQVHFKQPERKEQDQLEQQHQEKKTEEKEKAQEKKLQEIEQKIQILEEKIKQNEQQRQPRNQTREEGTLQEPHFNKQQRSDNKSQDPSKPKLIIPPSKKAITAKDGRKIAKKIIDISNDEGTINGVSVMMNKKQVAQGALPNQQASTKSASISPILHNDQT